MLEPHGDLDDRPDLWRAISNFFAFTWFAIDPVRTIDISSTSVSSSVARASAMVCAVI